MQKGFHNKVPTNMENADRTVEMAIPKQDAPPAAPATSPVDGADRATPVFPQASSIDDRIPAATRRARPSPQLDPMARARISGLAKWIILAAVMLFVAWLPAKLFDASLASGANQANLDRSTYYLAAVMAAATFASVFATGIPRIFFPRIFGKWHEAVEAGRDWVFVGVITGGLYWVGIALAKTAHFGPAPSGGVVTQNEWFTYRLPILLVAGVVGVLVARILAIRRDGVLSSSVGAAVLQIVVQVVLLAVFERPFEKLFPILSETKGIAVLLAVVATLCAVTALGIISWAMAADASLTSIRSRRGATGVNDGTGPVDLTLTVIGGRESGKTVLLAAAYYEWTTQNIGNLRITPAPGRGTSSQSVTNLEEVARELYINNQFPVGTVSTQNLPFDLSLGAERIARFTFLDYPGGAIAGRVADSSVVQEFWERVEDTDGIVMIADMSYVRRAKRDNDFLEVRNAYRTVMQRLVDRNGKRRVVPVALVLTKCDEFVDPNTGHIDVNALKEGLREFQYDQLEEEWRRLNATTGPGVIEFSTWITSAITYSQPQLGRDGRPDYSRPFQIAPPPPAIAPTGCASPLLWMTTKVLRWNSTLFYDISTFLFGSTPTVRRRVEAVLEMERIIEERAGRA